MVSCFLLTIPQAIDLTHVPCNKKDASFFNPFFSRLITLLISMPKECAHPTELQMHTIDSDNVTFAFNY